MARANSKKISEVKRIDALSLAKLLGILYAVIGFIIGIFITLFSFIGFERMAFGALFGVGTIILLPIFYGIIGFIFGIITAFIYNLVAGWIGGIKIETR